MKIRVKTKLNSPKKFAPVRGKTLFQGLETPLWVFLYLVCTYSCTKVDPNQKPREVDLQQPLTASTANGGFDISGSDFTVAVLPDTQGYINDFANCDGTPGCTGTYADQKTYMFGLSEQINYIISHKDPPSVDPDGLNIKYVVGLGDIVEHSDSLPPGYQQLTNGTWKSNDHEWRKAYFGHKGLDPALADDGIDALRRNNVPFGLAVGNHDMFPHLDKAGSDWSSRKGKPSQSSTIFYNKYFGIDSINHARCWWYGDHYGNNNNNHWDAFSAGGQNFIFIYIQYNSDPAGDPEGLDVVNNWMKQVLEDHKTYKAVIVSHSMVAPEVGTKKPFFCPQAQAIINVAKEYENVFLMLGGHYGPGDPNDKSGTCELVKDTTVSTSGGKVHTIRGMTANYQDRPDYKGNGLFRLLRFSVKNDDITVRTYSRWAGGGEQGYRDTVTAQFTIPLFHRAPVAEIPNGVYTIHSFNTDGVNDMVVTALVTTNEIVQRPYQPTWKNQQWTFTQIGNTGYYKVVCVYPDNTKALVVENASPDPLTRCIQYTYTSGGSRNDEWGLIPDDTYTFTKPLYKFIAGHDGLTMQVANASLKDSAIIRQNDFHSYKNEVFYLTPVN